MAFRECPFCGNWQQYPWEDHIRRCAKVGVPRQRRASKESEEKIETLERLIAALEKERQEEKA